MGKDKLKRFAENEVLPNVFQPDFNEIFRKDYKLKKCWHKEYFKNNNPIVLELGCGKGEYTVNLARMYPKKNFIGIDVKGARLWRGAKTAYEENLSNVAFLRTRIEQIESFFGINEVSEIWITFPDPQLKRRRTKKRLTSSRFLNYYVNFLENNAVVNLKTDSQELYEYTSEILRFNNIEPEITSNDIYNSKFMNEELQIKTFYEQKYLEVGKRVTYVRFHVEKKEYQEIPEKVFVEKGN